MVRDRARLRTPQFGGSVTDSTHRAHDAHPASRAAGSPRHTLSRVFTSARLAKLGLWYLLLLIPTIYFKHSYLDSLAEEGVLAAVGSGSLVASLGSYLALFAADFFEVLLIVLALFLIGHLLLRINLDWLVAICVALCMVVSAGNWLSFQVIGTLLNADNLEIALSWIRAHPETMTQDQSGRLLLVSAAGLVLLALLWSSACFLLLRGGVTERSVPVIARWTLALALALQVISAATLVHRMIRHRPSIGTSRGYWSATATSLGGAEHWDPFELALPKEEAIESSYRDFAYSPVAVPDSSAGEQPLVGIPPRARIARHIVFISLETAARKYYPVLDNPRLPTFARMASRGIASDHHLSTNPATTWAVYSMLTGTYPRRGRSLLDYGDFSSDGLAAVLGRHGYETTYLDSYKIDWQSGFHRDHNSRMVKDLGFMSIEDIAQDSVTHASDDAFENAVARERHSLSRALQRIDDARGHNAHAFVFIATILGHYPWAAKGTQSLTGAEKLAVIAGSLDGLLAELLRGIDARGLSDSVIIVVTGDHGLRAKGEFASLNERMRFGTISFNVPFVLYAPGLFDHSVRLSNVTSHVDIAPTLLELVGIPTDSLLLHGTSMLDPHIRGRTTFMLNNSLRPVDGYYQNGWLYVYNAFTGESRVERTPEGAGSPSPDGYAEGAQPSAALTARVAATLDRAAGIFDTTSAYFLQRGAATRAGSAAIVSARP